MLNKIRYEVSTFFQILSIILFEIFFFFLQQNMIDEILNISKIIIFTLFCTITKLCLKKNALNFLDLSQFLL